MRDQFAHFAAAVVALLPLVLWPGLLAGAWAGLCMGLAREVTEEGGPVSLTSIRAALGSRLDLSFWALGGALAGFLTEV